MDYHGFITTVVERTEISSAEAERAACTTLHTLAQCISTGEAEDIAERLPEFRVAAAPVCFREQAGGIPARLFK